jgi:signal transduction histidine kinase
MFFRFPNTSGGACFSVFRPMPDETPCAPSSSSALEWANMRVWCVFPGASSKSCSPRPRRRNAASNASFNITLEREFDPAVTAIELAPQEMTRVFLNLFGNGFYAATKRARGNGEAAYRPILQVSTRDLGEAVEVRVRDNWTGIRSEIKDQLFQPFFTTKPTGEGTGLGLSISWDIVTQQHGGTIAVDSREGEFTEFTIRLPRNGQAAGSSQ